MFGLFKSAPYADPQFGEFIRTKGHWRGSITLPGHQPVPLVLAGDKKVPAPAALADARQISPAWSDWRAVIEAALYEHYEPYRDSACAEAETPAPVIATPGEIWPHTALQYVAVTTMSGGLTVEFGYAVDWDQEHTLGARFQQGRFLELNGSV